MANRYKEMYEKTHEEAMKLDAENRQLKLEIERLKVGNEVKEVIKETVDDIARDMLFEECLDTFASCVFKFAVENPLEYQSFDNWWFGLTREQLLMRASKEVKNLFEEMRLSDIREYFRSSALKFYRREERAFLERCNKMIYESVVTSTKGKVGK